MVYFRHERIRPSQKELMDDIYDAIANNRNFMAHAPTGLGKTDAAISAAATHAIENDQTVFFLTPKISQHRIAMEVVNGLAEKHKLDIRGVDLVGRANCCIHKNIKDLDGESFFTSCGKKIKDHQCIFYSNAKGHGRMAETRAELRFNAMLSNYGSGKPHHDLIREGEKKACCPYEWLIKLAEVSNVVIADYYHLMIPSIREILFLKIKKRIEDSIIIVDEAHNLASRIRSSLSRSVNNFVFSRVEKEMAMVGPGAGPLEEEFSKWAAEILGKKEELTVAAFEFDFFIQKFGLSIEDAIEQLTDAGISYVEKTNKKSACLALASFMIEWKNDQYRCVRILKKKEGRFFLSKRLLDPSPTTKILNQCPASILMSGSLLPLEMHRDVLGLDLEKTVMKHYPSPFDPENTINIITENLTTKYTKRNEENYQSIAKNISSIIEHTPGGTALFFPSYQFMNNVLPFVSHGNLHIQSSGMKPPEIKQMIEKFKKGGVLCAVQGGSLAEGVDFSNGEIKTAVVIGVALDEMDVETKALIDYYEEKFSRGWDYGYLYPGTIKALQAAGRGRRKESDRVAVVYMDERFKWRKYNWILNRDEEIIVTDNAASHVARFWE